MTSELTSTLSEQLSLLEGPLTKLVVESKPSLVKKPRKLTNHQVFISRAVKGMEGCKDGRAWARETKICSKIFDKYGVEFVMSLTLPYGKQVESLAYFICRDGQEFLSSKLVEYTMLQNGQKPIPESAPLSAEKIDDDLVVIPKKPQTLKEFLKYGQENC